MTKVAYNACFGGFSISKECAEYMANLGNKECLHHLAELSEEGHEFYGSLYDTPRHDAILILALEALGEKASGGCADIQIREIKGDRYYIKEYDGSESVVTPRDISWTIV
jgi:hypothetical protein